MSRLELASIATAAATGTNDDQLLVEEDIDDDNDNEQYQYPYQQQHGDHEFVVPPDEDEEVLDKTSTTTTTETRLLQHVQELSQALQSHVSNQERIMNKLSTNFNTGTARELTDRSMDLLRSTNTTLASSSSNNNNTMSSSSFVEQQAESFHKSTTLSSTIWAQLVEIRAELTTIRTLQSLCGQAQNGKTQDNIDNDSSIISSTTMTKKLDTVLDQLSKYLEMEGHEHQNGANNDEGTKHHDVIHGESNNGNIKNHNAVQSKKDENEDSLSRPPSSPSLKSTASTASTTTTTTTPHQTANNTAKDDTTEDDTTPSTTMVATTTSTANDTTKDENIRIIPSSPSSPSLSLSPPRLSLRDAIYKIATENDLPTIKAGTQLLYLYCVNLSSKPNIPRYRKVYTCNESFRQKVEKLQGSMDLLYAVGFVNKGNYVEWETSSKTASPKKKKKSTDNHDEAEVMKINLLKQAAAALSILKSQAVTSLDDNGSNHSFLHEDDDHSHNANEKKREVSLSLAKAALGALPPSSSHVVPADQDTVPTCVHSHQTPSSGATAASATIDCAAETPRSNSSPTPLALRSSINHDDINNGSNHGKGTNYLTSSCDVLTPDPGRFIVSPPDTKKHSYLTALSGFPDGPLELLDNNSTGNKEEVSLMSPPPPIAKESYATSNNSNKKPSNLNISPSSDDSTEEDLESTSTRLLFSGKTIPSSAGKPCKH